MLASAGELAYSPYSPPDRDFVSSETEVEVADPNKLEVIDAVGCPVREVCI